MGLKERPSASTYVVIRLPLRIAFVQATSLMLPEDQRGKEMICQPDRFQSNPVAQITAHQNAEGQQLADCGPPTRASPFAGALGFQLFRLRGSDRLFSYVLSSGVGMQVRKVRRSLIVVAAYLISFVGGFPLMAMGAYTILFNDPLGVSKLAPLIWLFAWISHVKMSVAWVKNRAVSRRWPIWGTVAGVLSLASPLLLVMSELPASAHHIEAALVSSAVVAAFLLPCILLAIYLVRFHLQVAGGATLPDA